MTFYLKYRPKDFKSLVGQEFIKNTLSQAIKKDSIVGAYLFCGPRGTGKTSTARIFAKALNCLDLQDGNPCGKCEICRGFDEESLTDIIEIDAASYTGVDHIRDIIEKANFSPNVCKYKIYIIDEVHMLSKGAFNALLKILEEPPAHLKFILATTEIHKVPETILSRCQRYDFKSIGDDDIKKRLQEIAKLENIEIDDLSLNFIIKQSKGGLRNAISLFQQLNFGGKIEYEKVLSDYGLPDENILRNFYQKLTSGDETIIDDFEDISAKYDILAFFKELLFLLKEEIISHIGDKDFVKQHIFFLETLENSYIKTKNTFDIETTFLIGVIKCIKNITPKTQIDGENLTSKNTQKETSGAKISPTKIEEIKKVEPQKEEISHDDIFDVFGGEESIEIENSLPQNHENQNIFDKEVFIEKVKNLGAKGALTMSLRGSQFQLTDNLLVIYTKTKMALKMISGSDEIAFMSKALEEMNLGGKNIEIK